jgi:hypothetical protein
MTVRQHRTSAELRAEISRLDTNLAKIAGVERKEDATIAELALAIFRHDKKAASKINAHEHRRASAIDWQRRLRGARSLLEAELMRAAAAEDQAEAVPTDLKIMESQDVV